MARSKALWKGEYREKRDDQGNLLERAPVEHLPGVPAHDLTADEYDALSDEQRDAVQGGTLYEVVDDSEGDNVPLEPAQPASPMASARARRGFGLEAAAEAAATVEDAETITVVSPTASSTDGGSE